MSPTRTPAGHKIRKIALILMPLLVLAGGLWVASQLLQSAPQAGRRPPPERQPRLVEVVEAARSTQPVMVTAFGEVRPSRQVELRAQVAGEVVSLHPDFEPGAAVAKGTVLASLERRDYELRLAQAKSNLSRAEAELAMEQGQQTVARREFELLGKDASEAEQRLMLRRPQLQVAQAAVAQAEAEVRAAELALQRTRVAAPFDALVLDRVVAPGSQLGAAGLVATLAGTEQWWVELAVSPSALRWIEASDGDQGGSVVRLFDAKNWGEGVYRQGRVVRVLGEVQASSRMARVLVAVADPLAMIKANADKPGLLMGAFLRAEIVGPMLPEAIAIDPSWLRQGDRVWIMDERDELAARPVQIEYRGDDVILVSDGIEAGERIVTTTLNAVAEGQPLRLRNGSEAADE